MNELKEEINKLLKDLEPCYTIGDDKDDWNQNKEDSLKEIVQLIETYTAKKELEARIDEWKYISEIQHSAAITGELYFNKERKDRLRQLNKYLEDDDRTYGIIPDITQLSSQLTNNKGGIENE